MYQKEKGNVQKRLSLIALHIIDLCNPVAEKMNRKFGFIDSESREQDNLIDYAKFQLQACCINLNDDTRIIISKMRDTIVVLEMLRNCRLLSKEDILPVLIECGEVLEVIQNESCIH